MTRVSITFEKFREELISFRGFLIRLLKFYLIATVLLFSSLLPGALGLHLIEGMTFTDSFVDAISILGTIDPPFPPETFPGKGFIAIFGVFADTVFLFSVALLVAPIVHRVFHRLHLEE